MKNRRNRFSRLKKSFQNTLSSSKKSINKLSNEFGSKFDVFKEYLKSPYVEDDLDQLIMRLQMFDTDLTVPNMDKLNRNQRITKKIKIIKSSFKRLNIEYGSYGMLLGSLFGPKGAAAGAPLGSYIFAACLLSTACEKFLFSDERILLS